MTVLYDMHRWLESDSARSFVGFILALNEAVRGRKLSDPVAPSPAVDNLMKVARTSSPRVALRDGLYARMYLAA